MKTVDPHTYTPHFLEQRYLFALYKKVGLARTVMIACVIAFFVGTLVIVPVNMIMGGKVLTGLTINLILCSTLLPYHLFQMVSLLGEMDSMREEMHDKSIHDELTKAFNRYYLLDKIRSVNDKDAVLPGDTSILLIDLDDFKKINDRYGHSAGDDVLKLLAETCRSVFRSTDVFVRYGGDEFICLLSETSIEQAMEIAQRLNIKVGQLKVPTSKGAIKFTISIGVANGVTGQKLERLISFADQALYKAKHLGKNQITMM